MPEKLSGIFLPVHSEPQKRQPNSGYGFFADDSFRGIGTMILNPVFWVIDQFRLLVLWGTIPSRMNMINLVLLSAIILVLGVIVFKRYEKKLTLKF